MLAITLHQAADTKVPCTYKSMDAHAFSSLIPIIPTEHSLVLTCFKVRTEKFVVHHNSIPLVSNDLLALFQLLSICILI